MDLRTFEVSSGTSIQVLTHRQILGFGVNIIQKNYNKIKLTLAEFRKFKDILPKCYRMMLHFGKRKRMKASHNLPPNQHFPLSKRHVVTLVHYVDDDIILRICPTSPPKEGETEPTFHYGRCIMMGTKTVGRFHRMWPAINRHISCQFDSTMKIVKMDSPMALKQAHDFLDRFYRDGRGYARLVLQKPFAGKPYQPGTGITLPEKHLLKIPKLKVVGNKPPKMQKVGHDEWPEVAMEVDREKAWMRPYSSTALSMYPTCGGGVGRDRVEETEKSIRRHFETLRLDGARGDIACKETRYELTEKGAKMEMDEKRHWHPRGVLQFNKTGVEPFNSDSYDEDEEDASTEEEDIFSDDQQETVDYKFASYQRNNDGKWVKVDKMAETAKTAETAETVETTVEKKGDEEKEKEEEEGKKEGEEEKKEGEELKSEFDKETELIYQSTDDESDSSDEEYSCDSEVD